MRVNFQVSLERSNPAFLSQSSSCFFLIEMFYLCLNFPIASDIKNIEGSVNKSKNEDEIDFNDIYNMSLLVSSSIFALL